MSKEDGQPFVLKEWIGIVDSDIKTLRENQADIVTRERKVGNKCNEFIDSLTALAAHESNKSLRRALADVAEAFRSIEVDRIRSLQHMERIVVKRLDDFRGTIKKHKDVLNRRNSSADRLKTANRAVEKLTSKPQRDDVKIVQAKQQLLSSQVELERDEETLAKGTVQMEISRINLVQDSLARYANSYIYFYCRAIETMSGVSRIMNGIEGEVESVGLLEKMAAFDDRASSQKSRDEQIDLK